MHNTCLPSKNSKVVVAMSGGVDSSTVAAMMKEEGYDIIGITLQLYDYGQAMSKRSGACCAGQDIYDAKMVADKLGFPHYILDYESKFKQSVIDDFANSYLRGETPLPCVRCNQSVKFRDLLEAAKSLGAGALVTGHYVQRMNGASGAAELHKGVDPSKDQSYFLFATTQEQLEFLYFPLGGTTKSKTRELATKYGLINADKPDSQDICFVPDGNYADIVRKLRPEAEESGKIVHVDGYTLGEHKGIINYTIGQRRGLKVAFNSPLYVVKIDPIQKIVYVGGEKDLYSQTFTLKDINWLGTSSDLEKEVTIKVRSLHSGSKAKVEMLPNGSMRVKTIAPEKAITPGQACVIYDGSKVLGGGWIIREG